MRRFVLLIGLCLFRLGSLLAAAADKPFSISIVPESRSKESSYISWGKESKRIFFVLLTNLTKKPQPVFERWNSWGYQTIAFELVLPDGRKAKATAKPQIFTVNGASTYLVPPQGHQVFPITLNDEWDGKPDFGKAGSTKVMLKAIYEVAPTQEAKDQGVWVGRIESEPIEVHVRHW